MNANGTLKLGTTEHDKLERGIIYSLNIKFKPRNIVHSERIGLSTAGKVNWVIHHL